MHRLDYPDQYKQTSLSAQSHNATRHQQTEDEPPRISANSCWLISKRAGEHDQVTAAA